LKEEEEEELTESLAQLITRLETFTDTERIRIPKGLVDKKGNILLPVVGIYGLDTTGGTHELVNTTGYLKVAGGDVATSPVPTFPGGTLLSTQYSFTNDGANSGNHSIKIEPATDCPMFLYNYAVYNGDAAGRATTLTLHGSGAVQLAVLYTATLGATSYDMWPDEGGAIGPLPVPANQELVSTVAAVAVSKATRHALVYRYFGATAPTVTTTGPTNCTIAAIA